MPSFFPRLRRGERGLRAGAYFLRFLFGHAGFDMQNEGIVIRRVHADEWCPLFNEPGDEICRWGYRAGVDEARTSSLDRGFPRTPLRRLRHGSMRAAQAWRVKIAALTCKD